MRRVVMRRGVIVLLGTILAAPALWAGPRLHGQVQGLTPIPGQTPPGAPGQNTPPPQVGTGLIVGQVVDAASGEPLADVVVSSGRSNPPPTSGPPPAVNVFQPVVTGADGRFVFRNLPAGAYPIRATLAGYVPGMVGQGRPGGPDRTVVLADGARVGDATIRLWKYGVISGTLVDEAGEPATDLTVRAYRRITVNGRTQLLPATTQTARTDDRGRYRFTRLTPGDYIVLVPLTQSTLPVSTFESLLQAMVSDPTKPPDWYVDLVMSGGQAALQGAPARVGDVLWGSSFGGTPPPSETGRSTSYRTTYYPSASSVSQASAVTVQPGEERTSIDLQLSLVPTVRVSGTVVGPTGPMPNLAVRLQPAGMDPLMAGSELENAVAVTRANGVFTFINVTPGQYTIRVIKPGPNENMMRILRGEVAGPPSPSPIAPPVPTLVAEQLVTVGDTDVAGLSVSLREGAKVSGRVEFDLTPPRTAAQVTAGGGVVLSPVGGSSGIPGSFAADPATLDADGRFKTSGSLPGRYTIGLGRTGFVSVGAGAGRGGGPMVKSITANGRDITNAPLELKDSDITDVVIKISDRAGSIAGNVRTAAGQPASTATTIIFPADYRAMVANGMTSGRVMTVAASRLGAYSANGLLAGEYLIVAVEDADVADNQDVAFFDALARGATRITLGDAEKKVQDLVIVAVKR